MGKFFEENAIHSAYYSRTDTYKRCVLSGERNLIKFTDYHKAT